MNIEEALSYIHKTKWLGTKPGLSRTRRLLGALGDPQKSLKFVHVAGTNGKGSTCAMIASILRESGFCVGLYTSPYITVFNERMQVVGQNITDDELIHIVETIRPAAHAMTDDPPTEFEVITAAAMLYFLEKKCDLVVLEVGMGGTLDSTNVIEAPECACSVICAIGLDHTAYLGDTVEKIAAVKAGILKENVPVVMYPEKESVEKVIRSAAKEKHCPLTAPDFSLLSVQNYSLDGIDFSYGALSGLHLPLIGTYQPCNAAVAIETARVLRMRGYSISDEDIRRGLSEVVWKGRFEVLRKEPVFLLDGSHNPHGMRATVDAIRQYFGEQKLHFVLGAMADKDVSTMLSLLLPEAERFYTVTAPNPRAMKGEELAQRIRSLGGKAEAFGSIETAVNAAAQNAEKDGVCAALGTLYFSQEVRSAVEGLAL